MAIPKNVRARGLEKLRSGQNRYFSGKIKSQLFFEQAWTRLREIYIHRISLNQ